MNIPILGGQKDRKLRQKQQFQEECFRKLRQWEYDNNLIVIPVLGTSIDSIAARITFQAMPDEVKQRYELTLKK